MIAFSSQRGGGADLATHLSNSEDNEHVDVHEIRGVIAEDLHGFMGEIEAHARAMTKCKKELLSVSINPDERDGRLTREQYEDYIERAEIKFGLIGQPRAVVFHIKEGKDGDLREHCHVVWSRIDVNECRAINIPFDRYKLMQVSREFALDHGRSLPDGYETGRAKDDQLSLYEKSQQELTGLTREERREIITKLWQSSDTPSAFVAALSDNGYILSQGRRPYRLVDYYGGVHSLPKMIDDKQVRLDDVKSFLALDFPNEDLPTVEEAQDLAKKHRDQDKIVHKKEEHAEQREILLRGQDERAHKLQTEIADVRQQHLIEREAERQQRKTDRAALEQQQIKTNMEIEFKRQQNDRSGVVAILAKMSGAAFVRRLLHEREDRKRSEFQFQDRVRLETNQREERQKIELRQGLEMRELQRQEIAQKLTFQREQQSLQKKQQRELAVHYRRGHDHMPQAALTLTPSGRMAQPERAQHRHSMQTAKELNVKAKSREQHEKPVEPSHDFEVSAHQPEQKQSGHDKSVSQKFANRNTRRGQKR